MAQERDAISLRNVPLDTVEPADGQLMQYEASTRKWKLISPLLGTKIYYVADTSGGSPTRKLTFQSGILISET